MRLSCFSAFLVLAVAVCASPDADGGCSAEGDYAIWHPLGGDLPASCLSCAQYLPSHVHIHRREQWRARIAHSVLPYVLTAM